MGTGELLLGESESESEVSNFEIRSKVLEKSKALLL
jgi:hypothetical protein